MSDLQYTLGLDGSQFDSTAKAAEKTGMNLGRVLAGLGVTAFAGGVLKRGFEFNQTMRDSEAAIAKVIGQFQHLNETASKDAAAGAMRQLIDLEPKAAGSLADLTNGFLSTLAASQSAGLSVQQNIDLVGRFANAMGNANIPTAQLGQEMRSIVTANIGADSSLAKILGITNEMVQQAQEAGNLYGFLTTRIGKLGEAGDTAAVAFSSLQSAVDKAAGALAQGLFDEALAGSKDLTASLDANKETFLALGGAITVAAKEAAAFAGFVAEAAKQAGYWLAVARDMVGTGQSFGEITAEMDAIANAQAHAAAVAQDHAEAEKQVATAADNAANALARARDAAAQATKKAGLTNAPSESASKGKKKDTSAEDQARAFDDILDKQARLDDLKRQSAMDQMTTAGKAAQLQQELLAAEQHLAALRADPFSQDQGKILDAEAKKVELEREFKALQKQVVAEAVEGAKKAQSQTKAQAERATEMERARNSQAGELAVLEAQAKGQNKKADAIRRQLQIERDKLDIMRQTGASEEEALRMATRKADLETKIAKGESGGKGGRSHIGGVGNRRMMGGGVADFEALQKGESDFDRLQKGESDFDRLQKGESDFDRLQKSKPGSGGLSERGATSTVGGSTARVSRLMGQTDSRSLAERGQAATAGPQAKPSPAKPPGNDPSVSKLDAILGELTRIRTS